MGVNSEVIALLQRAIAILSSQGPVETVELEETVSSGRRAIAWGAKVSPVFRERVWWIADALRLNPDDLKVLS